MSEICTNFEPSCESETYVEAVKQALRSQRIGDILGSEEREPSPVYLSIFEAGRKRTASVRRCAEAITSGVCPRFGLSSEEVA